MAHRGAARSVTDHLVSSDITPGALRFVQKGASNGSKSVAMRAESGCADFRPPRAKRLESCTTSSHDLPILPNLIKPQQPDQSSPAQKAPRPAVNGVDNTLNISRSERMKAIVTAVSTSGYETPSYCRAEREVPFRCMRPRADRRDNLEDDRIAPAGGGRPETPTRSSVTIHDR